jgi:hypothetical protein
MGAISLTRWTIEMTTIRAFLLNVRRNIRLQPIRRVAGMMTVAMLVASTSSMQGATNSVNVDPQNLPVYTSPIDITGFRMQIHFAAPDRNTQKPVDINVPVGLIGPQMNQLFNTPVSTMLDQQWAQVPDKKTGRTPIQTACDGIKTQIGLAVQKLGSGFTAYNVNCNLAQKGQLLIKQAPSSFQLGYLLTNNQVDFKITSPATCKSTNGTPFCPNDPGFKVTFAIEITTAMSTPDLCHLRASDVTVITQSVNIEGSNTTGSLVRFGSDLIPSHKFTAAERSIQATQMVVKSPLDDYFQEMRTNQACTAKNSPLAILLAVFDFETAIERTSIIFRLSHRPIAPPSVSVPDAAAKAVSTPAQPSFTRPTISANRPSVLAGSQIQISGIYFPPNMDFSHALPVTIAQGGSILGGVCQGGATELQWGPTNNAQAHNERLTGDAKYSCGTHFDARGLTPGTAYEFRARDCDAITCSPWSALAKGSTSTANSGAGTVSLTIDGAPETANAQAAGPGRVSALQRAKVVAPTPAPAPGRISAVSRTPLILASLGTNIGSAVVTPQGTFTANVTIPAGIAPGSHTIKAVDGSATAEITVVVAGASAGGSNASIMMVGLLRGESGCPNHPISSTQTDATFVLFGAGFAPGAVTLHLDSPAGAAIGSATPGRDGSFCQTMPGIPGRSAGAHKLVAVQNGAVQTQIPVTFVLPSVVR